MAAHADAAACRAIASDAYAIYTARMGQTPPPALANFESHAERNELFVLIDENPDVVGYCVLWTNEDHLHLSNVAVSPSWHGRGYGRALIEFAESEAIRRGLNRVELYTNIHMTENQALYSSLGYTEFDRRIEHGVSRIYYRKGLHQ